MTYKVEVSDAAAKTIRKLPQDKIKRIEQKINKLAKDPRPVGVEKLTGKEQIYRIRSELFIRLKIKFFLFLF